MNAPNTTVSALNTSRARRVRFHLAGFVFTYNRDAKEARVRIEMWREDPATLERHWITVATTAPDRASARRVAMALVAWVQWCDVAPRKDLQSQAVAESWAILQQRMAMKNPKVTGSITARPMLQPVPPSNSAESACE